MSAISIMTLQDAPLVEAPEGSFGVSQARGYFLDTDQPLMLHVYTLQPGGRLPLKGAPTDCLAYVWRGGVEAGGRQLDARSSVIAEHGAAITVTAGPQGADIVTFVKKQQGPSPRAGGHVHLIPAEIVPRADGVWGGNIGGALHADGCCPTCDVWLHENDFPQGPIVAGGCSDDGPDPHSHSESEIIFVREGSMGLGKTYYGPGTALAVKADTTYRFTKGPDGLSILNCHTGVPFYSRPGDPAKDNEATLWHDSLGKPRFLEASVRRPGSAQVLPGVIRGA